MRAVPLLLFVVACAAWPWSKEIAVDPVSSGAVDWQWEFTVPLSGIPQQITSRTQDGSSRSTSVSIPPGTYAFLVDLWAQAFSNVSSGNNYYRYSFYHYISCPTEANGGAVVTAANCLPSESPVSPWITCPPVKNDGVNFLLYEGQVIVTIAPGIVGSVTHILGTAPWNAPHTFQVVGYNCSMVFNDAVTFNANLLDASSYTKASFMLLQQ